MRSIKHHKNDSIMRFSIFISFHVRGLKQTVKLSSILLSSLPFLYPQPMLTYFRGHGCVEKNSLTFCLFMRKTIVASLLSSLSYNLNVFKKSIQHNNGLKMFVFCCAISFDVIGSFYCRRKKEATRVLTTIFHSIRKFSISGIAWRNESKHDEWKGKRYF